MVSGNSMKVKFFEELHPDELEQIIKESGIVYLPLGTLEWHERHLPFGLDAFVSYEICKELSKRIGGCVIPPLFFGTDREHKVEGMVLHGMDARAKRTLPGSIYFLKKDLFLKVLLSITENVKQQGFKTLVIVSAHSGTAQQETLAKLAQVKFGALRILVFPGKEFVGGMDHAAKLETGLMMALKPELVHMHKLKAPYEAIAGEDPLLARKSEGKRHIDAIVEDIAREILKRRV
jgi:creatinine amidohydrolase